MQEVRVVDNAACVTPAESNNLIVEVVKNTTKDLTSSTVIAKPLHSLNYLSTVKALSSEKKGCDMLHLGVCLATLSE